MTTREAFKKLINERGIYHKLGVSQGAVSQYRYALKNGDPLSTDLMESLLLKAGWVVVQEKKWANDVVIVPTKKKSDANDGGPDKVTTGVLTGRNAYKIFTAAYRALPKFDELHHSMSVKIPNDKRNADSPFKIKKT